MAQTGQSVSRPRMGTNKCLMSAGEGSVKEYSQPWTLQSGRCSQAGTEGTTVEQDVRSVLICVTLEVATLFV